MEHYSGLQAKCEALRGEKEVWQTQWERTHERAKKAEKFARAMHEGFRVLLAQHDIKAIVYADTGEVLEVTPPNPLTPESPSP
jgi:hypothetical protein